MARDRVLLADGAGVEVMALEDALYPCPQCGKGGSPAPSERCPTCAQEVQSDALHCVPCAIVYARASVPVMAFVCRVCQLPGTSATYIEDGNARVHDACR